MPKQRHIFRNITLTISLVTSILSGVIALRWSRLSPTWIAHAGGAFNGQKYTNSQAAMEASVKAGFKFVELDFEWTSDDQIVLLHDWDGVAASHLGLKPDRKSLADFLASRPSSGFAPQTFDHLLQWLQDHPAVSIVTDAKSRNLDVLRAFSSRLPSYAHQVIPQAYQLNEVPDIRELGFERIIFTLYRSSDSDTAIKEAARRHNLFAITMPLNRALRTRLAFDLSSAGIPVFVHPVDHHWHLWLASAVGATGFYTTYLGPDAR